MATKRNILDILLQKRLGFSPQEAFLSLPKWHYWWEMASTISSIITENIFGQRENKRALLSHPLWIEFSFERLNSCIFDLLLIGFISLSFYEIRKFRQKSYGCWGPSSVHEECFAHSFECVQWTKARMQKKQ